MPQRNMRRSTTEPARSHQVHQLSNAVKGIRASVIWDCRGEPLRTVKHEQHVLIACARLTKGDKRLILWRVVPSVERIHVGKLDDDNPVSCRGLAVVPFLGQPIYLNWDGVIFREQKTPRH